MNYLQVQLPDAEQLYIPTNNYNGINIITTPYQSKSNIIDTLKKYKIKVPFEKIITKYDGISICKECGAKTNGWQNNCPAIVEWYSKGYSCNNRMKPGVYIGKYIDGIYGTVIRTEWNKCDAYLTWDLQEEFNKQQRFFNIVNQFYTYGIDYPQSEFELFFGENSKELMQSMRICQLERKIENQEVQINQLVESLKFIAEKMNAAGHNLSF